MSESLTRVQIGSPAEPAIGEAVDCLRRFYPEIQVHWEGAEIVLQSALPPAQLHSVWLAHLHEARTRKYRAERRDELIHELFL